MARKSKYMYYFVVSVLLLWIFYTYSSTEYFTEDEEARIQKLEKKLSELDTEFKTVKVKLEAQGSQAAAAQASLMAIPNTGVNNVMPV